MNEDRPIPSGCAVGRHRARRVKLASEGAALQTTCRDCGCTLVRTQATRQWFYSGALGAA